MGDCPYPGCTEMVWRPIADLPLPRYEKWTCAGCGGVVWTKHSRIEPESWTEEDFPFIVDGETKTLIPKAKAERGEE